MGRYKVLTAEFADLMLGYYGHTLGERDPEVVELAEAQTKKARSPSGPPTGSRRVGHAARRRAGAGLQRHRRGRADVRDVPQGRPDVLRAPRKGPATWAKDPAEPSEPRPSSGQCDGCTSGTEDADGLRRDRWDGRAHRVTVSPEPDGGAR
jgi:methylmalonyl-CoA carboxyltransferase 5S subunit